MNQIRGHPMTVLVRRYDTASPAVDGAGVPTYFQQVLEGDRGDRELWERVAAEVLNPNGDWVEAPRIIGVLRHRGRYWAYALRTDLKDSHGRGGRQVFVIASASEATSLTTEIVFREFNSLLETVVNSRSSNAATGNPAAPDVKSADPARQRRERDGTGSESRALLREPRRSSAKLHRYLPVHARVVRSPSGTASARRSRMSECGNARRPAPRRRAPIDHAHLERGDSRSAPGAEATRGGVRDPLI